jgi:hypothetical protein
VRGHRSGEALVFAGASLLALLHGLDDAVVHRQPGVGLGAHAAAALVATALAVAGIAAFPRMRPGLRAALAAAFGVLALVHGVLHGSQVALDGPARSDVTGLLAGLAGGVLLGLAVAVLVRHRERGAARPAGRRWAVRAGTAVAALVAAYAVLLPVGVGIVQTHAPREPIGAPPSAAFRPVAFPAADGLRVAGWYVPSRNRAAVVLVHGGGGDRTGVVGHAELLARHGYGVLLHDARGRGESEGSPNAPGWGWEHDVAGALAFLRARPEVDAGRIGGLGLSTGADVLIEVAAEHGGLGAVVAEGATGRSFADVPPEDRLGLAYLWPMYAAIRVLSGASPGPPLRELVGRVAPAPLLLIAAGRFPAERDLNLAYARAAREPVALWDRRDGHHTAAIREEPREYERRVVGLLDEALLG